MEEKAKGSNKIKMEYRTLVKRGISEDTCKFYNYGVGEWNGQPAHFAQYYDASSKPAGVKVRHADKKFMWVGSQPGTFFGQQKFSGGKMLVITEGEIDAMSYAETHGCRWPTVSIPNGAQSATSVFKRNLEWLGGFEKIVLMFDQDEAGRKAAEECAVLLPPGKGSIATLTKKDPNDVLLTGDKDELQRAAWNAKAYIPGGLVKGEDLWEVISDVPEVVALKYPWVNMEAKTRGFRMGELVTLTAGTGIGKSQVCREIAYQFSQEDYRVAYFALEESVRKTALSFMSIHMGTPLFELEENFTDISEETLKSAFDASVGNGNLVLFDHFGSLHSERLVTKIRYAIKALDCKVVVLDHLSIVVSEFADSFERTAIDVTMTKLRALVEETGCGMILVSHLKRSDGRAHEEGGNVSLAQLRGSHGIAQLSDMCIGLERSQQAEGDEKYLTHIRILKNRYTGETGPSGYLRFHPETGRLHNHNDELGTDEFEELGG
tara:strand:- start:1148 stop:2620 length:1473 start_codon:yes stop_codon:yes gene_type:complete